MVGFRRRTQKVVRAMKSRKAPGAGRIKTEALKAGGENTAEMLLEICPRKSDQKIGAKV